MNGLEKKRGIWSVDDMRFQKPQTEQKPTLGITTGISLGAALGMSMGSAVGMSIGSAVGVSIGSSTGEMGKWIGVCLSLGMGIGTLLGLLLGASVAYCRSKEKEQRVE